MNYGQHPWKGIEPPPPGKNETAQTFIDRMHEIWRVATELAEKAAESQKRQYDKRKAPA